jgi:hypothetical protein
MRSLDNIFRHINIYGIEREILFEEGEWCMYRRTNIDDMAPLILHRCSKAQFSLAPVNGTCDLTWICGGDQPKGSGCGETTPPALKGLWYLYTWER